jgi:hypothetical protein
MKEKKQERDNPDSRQQEVRPCASCLLAHAHVCNAVCMRYHPAWLFGVAQQEKEKEILKYFKEIKGW